MKISEMDDGFNEYQNKASEPWWPKRGFGIALRGVMDIQTASTVRIAHDAKSI